MKCFYTFRTPCVLFGVILLGLHRLVVEANPTEGGEEEEEIKMKTFFHKQEPQQEETDFRPYTYIIEIINKLEQETPQPSEEDALSTVHSETKAPPVSGVHGQDSEDPKPNSTTKAPRLKSIEVTKKVEVFVEEGYDKGEYDHKSYDKSKEGHESFEEWEKKKAVSEIETNGKRKPKIPPVININFLEPPRSKRRPYPRKAKPLRRKPNRNLIRPVHDYVASASRFNRQHHAGNGFSKPKAPRSTSEKGTSSKRNKNFRVFMYEHPQHVYQHPLKLEKIPKSNLDSHSGREFELLNPKRYGRVRNSPLIRKNPGFFNPPKKLSGGFTPLVHRVRPWYPTTGGLRGRQGEENRTRRREMGNKLHYGSNIQESNPREDSFPQHSSRSFQRTASEPKVAGDSFHQERSPYKTELFDSTVQPSNFGFSSLWRPIEVLNKQPCPTSVPVIGDQIEIGKFEPRRGPTSWYHRDETFGPSKGQLDVLREQVYSPLLNQALCT